MKSILFLADKLPPHTGGMEMHAQYFIEYFSHHSAFPLSGVITKAEDGQDVLIQGPSRTFVDLKNLKQKVSPSIVFFNSGRWIEGLRILRYIFPGALFVYRTGGNEIIKAPLEQEEIPQHKHRQRFWAEILNENIDQLITNSSYTEQRLKKLGIDTPFVRCVGGVNFAALKNSHTRVRNETTTLVSVARFVPYKGHFKLIDVFHELLQRGLELKLRLIGDGPLLGSVKQKVHELGLEKKVEFLGELDNTAACQSIADADAYIQFSTDKLTKVTGGSYLHSEGMGRSILEAISAGKYVVAGESGALDEVIVGDRGQLVDLNGGKELFDQVEHCLKNIPTHLAPSEEYSWEKVFSKYEKIFAG